MEKDGRCFTLRDFTQGAVASHSIQTGVRDVRDVGVCVSAFLIVFKRTETAETHQNINGSACVRK